MESNEFDKGANKIISDLVDGIDIREDSYKPDENKFSDYLKFCRGHPKGDYSQFKKFCQERKKKSE
ncbi:hypothetical protein ES705_49458 [subsurface metagenome]|nr:MAG: hypothetical protein ES695_10720 [Candidatus Atribacteria bacterium 1244-E10-H5-B2]